MTMRFITLFFSAALLPFSALAGNGATQKQLLLDYGQDVQLTNNMTTAIRARCLRIFNDERTQPDPESEEVSMYPQCETDLVTQEGGEFARTGSCGRGMDTLIIYATTENPALLRGRNNYLSNNRRYLTPETPPHRSRLLQIVGPYGQERFDNDNGKGWVIDAEKLWGLRILGETAVLGLNPYGHDGCYLNVTVEKIHRPKKSKGGYQVKMEESPE